jgi:ABC transport system ATP-binding/permease protein
MWILQSREELEPGTVTFRILPGSVKTVGRATRADFVVDAALVSRFHCRLTASPSGALEVEDLRSTNGTFVNGERVQRLALAEGDRVRVGRVELVVGRG